MTENSDNNNWWGSWINAAKSKGTEVLEFVKKDLEEFGSAVKSEASSMVTSTGAVLEKTLKLDEPESTASNMKRSFSSFLGQMNTVLNPSPDDSDTEAILITEGSESVTLTKLQMAIYELQKNEKTFTQNPEECLNKKYECWLEIIDDQLSEERLTKHLTSSVTLNNQYLSLVPDQVSHQLFWKRYLFRKALIEDELAHQEIAEKREVKENQITEESLQWEKDFATDIDLTEEEQIKLLEQYENEKKQSPIKTPSKESSEEILFEKQSPKKGAKTSPKKITSKTKVPKKASTDKILENTNEDHFTVDVKPAPKALNLKINKTDSSSSLDAKSSNSSSDGDWEKISDTSEK